MAFRPVCPFYFLGPEDVHYSRRALEVSVAGVVSTSMVRLEDSHLNPTGFLARRRHSAHAAHSSCTNCRHPNDNPSPTPRL